MIFSFTNIFVFVFGQEFDIRVTLWLCLTLNDCMTLKDYIWLCIAFIWFYMMFLTCHDPILRSVTLNDSVWSCIIIYENVWHWWIITMHSIYMILYDVFDFSSPLTMPCASEWLFWNQFHLHRLFLNLLDSIWLCLPCFDSNFFCLIMFDLDWLCFTFFVLFNSIQLRLNLLEDV